MLFSVIRQLGGFWYQSYPSEASPSSLVGILPDPDQTASLRFRIFCFRFILFNSRFDDFFYQRCRKWIFCREMDSCAGSIPRLKLAAECFHDRFTHHIKAAMVPECGKEDQRSVILEHRNLVADDFFGLRSSSPDCPAKLFKNRSYVFGSGSKVLIDVFCWLLLLIFFHASFLIPLTPSLHPPTCTCDRWISFPCSRRHDHTDYTGTCTRQVHRG